MRKYTPRRQSRRWLDGDCPRGVLAIYDSGPSHAFDRYDVFYTETVTDHRGDVWVSYLASSSYGSHHHGEMRAHEVAEYRARVKHQAARWTDLPEAVREVVRRDLAGTA
jgi:hypothetical protein